MNCFIEQVLLPSLELTSAGLKKERQEARDSRASPATQQVQGQTKLGTACLETPKESQAWWYLA